MNPRDYDQFLYILNDLMDFQSPYSSINFSFSLLFYNSIAKSFFSYQLIRIIILVFHIQDPIN